MDPNSSTGRGRPGISQDIENRIAKMARDGVKPSTAVSALAESGTKVSTTKVYEIYRREKKAGGP